MKINHCDTTITSLQGGGSVEFVESDLDYVIELIFRNSMGDQIQVVMDISRAIDIAVRKTGRVTDAND